MNLPAFILHPIIRKKVAMHDLPLDQYSVRVARTAKEYSDAFGLVRAAYISLGYKRLDHDSGRVLPQHLLPESTVIVAYEGQRLVGTMTVIEDGPAGLPLEADYGPQIQKLRQQDARIVEYASLAIVERCHSTGVAQLLAMAAYYLATTTLGATHTVVGCVPKGSHFYQAAFNFEQLGAPKTHGELDVGMHALVQDMHATQSWFRKKYNTPMSDGVLPVEHFCNNPPTCIDLPGRLSRDDLVRYKLPRSVFQTLFLRSGNHVDRLDENLRGYLGSVRSRQTLTFADDAFLGAA